MSRKFFAILKGFNEVPPVRTNAFGKIELVVTKEGNLKYKLNVNWIKDMTQAHLHLGSKGVNGPVVVNLLTVNPAISVDHGVVTGVITKKDLVGPLKGKRIRDLVHLIENGKIYTNVHTIQNAPGEIRGQVHKRHY